MTIIRNPPEMPVPGTYSNGIEVPAGARTLYIAGQIGIAADGSVPEGIAAQTEIVFDNLTHILRSAGMDLTNLVKTTVFLTAPSDYAEFVKARTARLGATKPASTLVYIVQLVRPELKVEIEAVAVAA